MYASDDSDADTYFGYARNANSSCYSRQYTHARTHARARARIMKYIPFF